jgi:CrcB protein
VLLEPLTASTSVRPEDVAGRSVEGLPIDPDVEVTGPERSRLRLRSALRSAAQVVVQRWDVLVVIAVGGALGSAGRWAVAEAMPTAAGRIPWATFTVNVSGCLLLGALMVVVNDALPPSRYVRPFLGVGVLGGFTTFSTSMLDTRHLLVSGPPLGAALYLFGSLACGLVAVWGGIVLTRWAIAAARGRRRRRVPPEKARGGGQR